MKKKQSKLTKKQLEKLDEIYQNSIEEFSQYWEMARKSNNPDIVIDEIMNEHGDEIAKFCNCKNQDELYEKYSFSPRDWLYESVDAGIN